MDLYTTSFTLPRAPRAHNLRSPAPHTQLPHPNSGEPGVLAQSLPTPNNVTNPPARPARQSSSAAQTWTTQQVQREWEDVQRICSSITQREGCLVSATREDASDPSSPEPTSRPTTGRPAYNFHISGNYRSVLRARGATMREAPKDHRVVLKAGRMDLLESPLAASSVLKADVQRRLDEIAMDTLAELRVTNQALGPGGSAEVLGKAGVHPDPLETQQPAAAAASPQATKRNSGSGASNGAESSNISPVKPGSVGDAIEKAGSTAPSSVSRRPTQSGTSIGFGLESERLCEVVISGSLESVELAKVRILVMFDELVSVFRIMGFAKQDRAVFMPTAATLITSCTQSSLSAGAVSFRIFRRRQIQTSTFQHRWSASSTPLCLARRCRTLRVSDTGTQ